MSDECPHCKRPMHCNSCGRDLTVPLLHTGSPWMGPVCHCGARLPMDNGEEYKKAFEARYAPHRIMYTTLLAIALLCGSVYAAEDWTKSTNVCIDKDNPGRRSLSIDISEIKALKLSVQKEHEAIAKKFKEELKRFEKAKPMPKEEKKPADVVPIPENSVKKDIAPDGLSLLNISAKWCRPCVKFAPIVDELKSDGVNIVKADFDESKSLCEKLDVTKIPCCILRKDGVEIGRFTGVKTKKEVVQWILEQEARQLTKR